MLPLCLVQAGALNVCWAQAVLAVIGRTSWVLVWASLVLMVATATICSHAPALPFIKASVRQHSTVQVENGALQTDAGTLLLAHIVAIKLRLIVCLTLWLLVFAGR